MLQLQEPVRDSRPLIILVKKVYIKAWALHSFQCSTLIRQVLAVTVSDGDAQTTMKCWDVTRKNVHFVISAGSHQSSKTGRLKGPWFEWVYLVWSWAGKARSPSVLLENWSPLGCSLGVGSPHWEWAQGHCTKAFSALRLFWLSWGKLFCYQAAWPILCMGMGNFLFYLFFLHVCHCTFVCDSFFFLTRMEDVGPQAYPEPRGKMCGHQVPSFPEPGSPFGRASHQILGGLLWLIMRRGVFWLGGPCWAFSFQEPCLSGVRVESYYFRRWRHTLKCTFFFHMHFFIQLRAFMFAHHCRLKTNNKSVK